MTIAYIKDAIFFDNAKIGYCKHRKMKGAYEYFLIKSNGTKVKITGNKYKAVSAWLATRTVKNVK